MDKASSQGTCVRFVSELHIVPSTFELLVLPLKIIREIWKCIQTDLSFDQLDYLAFLLVSFTWWNATQDIQLPNRVWELSTSPVHLQRILEENKHHRFGYNTQISRHAIDLTGIMQDHDVCTRVWLDAQVAVLQMLPNLQVLTISWTTPIRRELYAIVQQYFSSIVNACHTHLTHLEFHGPPTGDSVKLPHSLIDSFASKLRCLEFHNLPFPNTRDGVLTNCMNLQEFTICNIQTDLDPSIVVHWPNLQCLTITQHPDDPHDPYSSDIFHPTISDENQQYLLENLTGCIHLHHFKMYYAGAFAAMWDIGPSSKSICDLVVH
ncbi:hypothetical protein BC938DRAFT_483943 [Jimgerdemannia flammicorona]|uniref:F-box domain-containing protein n=1 Tax=Jimgerdemannia flammicorona TaxID=994334 RepID=A0A433R061_9FUNG|nr:hypothetical protein BC938DRAFT_483943 [Jimgerdemannia flammicorona]